MNPVNPSRHSEVTICYYMEGTREDRQTHLKQGFGFSCVCSTCQLTGAALKESDTRQAIIKDLDDEIMQHAQRHAYSVAISLVEKRISLMQEEGLPAVWAKRTMSDAVQICQMSGDAAGVSYWAMRQWELAVIAGGKDSPESKDAEKMAGVSPSRGGKGRKNRK